MTDIEIPEDTRKSRLASPSKPEPVDDVATAAERIEAFWGRHPDGSILPEVERESFTIDDVRHVSYTVRVFIRKNADSETPDAVAHATRTTADPDVMTAQFPQETAETSAISRAIRNLGILATSRTAPPAPVVAPQTDEQVARAVSAAREQAGLSQRDLADAMRERNFRWSQATVSGIEKGERRLTLIEAQHLAEIIGFGS